MLTSTSSNPDITQLLKIVFDEANKTDNLDWEATPNHVFGKTFTLTHKVTGVSITKSNDDVLTYKECERIDSLCNSVLMLRTHDWEDYRHANSGFFSPELVTWCNAWNAYILNVPTGLTSSIGSIRLGHYIGWMAVK